MNAPQTPGPDLILLPEHQDLYDHLVHVLEQHLVWLRRIPLTGDLIEETVRAFDALDALVENLKIPRYDMQTAHGRLMHAIDQLNRAMPGVALRTLWHVHHYLATSDDDGACTREKAMGIIQGAGLGERERDLGTEMVRTFPPLP